MNFEVDFCFKCHRGIDVYVAEHCHNVTEIIYYSSGKGKTTIAGKCTIFSNA